MPKAPVKVPKAQNLDEFYLEWENKFKIITDAMYADMGKAPTVKAAAMRARTATNTLTKLMKEFRASSVAMDKAR